ncbi:unnamed protein product [Linum tenue]|uniref:AIG1-type G domain-containing protein n=1 Tax=Linum tenue TaxID=586396 RepID=A0AAV0RXJ4_9ROSI|nr:unnamed protein product [Linum tenue]
MEDTDDWVDPIVDRTLLLVGESGSGKSSLGNRILGQESFAYKNQYGSVTTCCEIKEAYLSDTLRCQIIDTPGVVSGEDDALKEIGTACFQVKRGVHAVLLVMSVRNRLEETGIVDMLARLFTPKIMEYVIVVFTGGDLLEKEGRSLDDYLGRDSAELQKILTLCGGRKVLFDNKTADKVKQRFQVRQLLGMVSKLEVQPYTFSTLFDELQLQNRSPAVGDLSPETEKVNALIDQAYQGDTSCFKEPNNESMAAMVDKKLQDTMVMFKKEIMSEVEARKKLHSEIQKLIAETKEAVRLLQLKVDTVVDEIKEIRRKSAKQGCRFM